MTELVEKNENAQNEFFQKLLNDSVDTEHVKVNDMANKSKYLPINIVERNLDEYFQHLWSVCNFNFQVIANEIVGTCELKVFHPFAKMWITRVGAASVMIQTKGQGSSLENKIKNTLGKDFPHLKAICIKNAAKSLGVVFGRNLNREDDGEFESLSEKVEIQIEKDERLETLAIALQIFKARGIEQGREDAEIQKGCKTLAKYPLEKLQKYVYVNENK